MDEGDQFGAEQSWQERRHHMGTHAAQHFEAITSTKTGGGLLKMSGTSFNLTASSWP
jgi:hypothetical protein